MDPVGNVLWDQILGVFSLIQKELSSTSLWRLSVSSSSKGPLLLPTHRDSKTEHSFNSKESWRKRNEMK